jgi:cellulose biosynthesis protein BcsQ
MLPLPGPEKATTSSLSMPMNRQPRQISPPFAQKRLGSPGYTAISLAGAAVRTQVLRLSPKYQDIIIDAGGRDTTGLRAGLTVADTALVPFQPRSFDLWTLDKAP